MNHPPIAFPRPAPELKLPRSSSPASAEKWAATLAEERRRLAEDEAALRERENNLREYEVRLRALQAEIEAQRTAAAPAPASASVTAAPFSRPSSSRTPFGDEPALQAGWEKLHRAREILEAEQTHLRDDRIAMREQEAAMKRREAAVAQREALLAEREATVAAMPKPAPAPVEEESTVSRLTSAPFKIARAVLGKS